MSTTGVPSIASMGAILNRVPATSRTVTPVKSDGIGATRRASGEYAGQRQIQPVARMHLKHIPLRLVKPGKDDEIVPDGNTRQSGRNPLDTSSQASGAPSSPWSGASLRLVSVERMIPTGSIE